jgi:hypothetical protein
MATENLFREVARNVDFPENAPWDFISTLTGDPPSGLPPGGHPNRGKAVKKTEKEGNKIEVSYEGTLRVRDDEFGWTSIETSEEDGDGNVEGEEVVTWKTKPPGALPQPTKMHTKWTKSDKTVINIGYR